MDQASLLRLLQDQGMGPESDLWEPNRPQTQPMLPQGGTGVDIARALQAALAQMQPLRGREGAGSALLRGAATGFSAATLGREGAKQTENEARKQANEKAEASYTLAAREMRKRRADLEAEKRKALLGGDKQPDRFRTPVEPPVKAGLGAPGWVETYGHLDEWQQSETDKRIAGERQAAAAAKAEQAVSEDADANDLAQQVADLRMRPSQIPLGGRGALFGAKVRNLTDKKLREAGSPYTLAKLDQMEQSARTFQRNMDSTRMVTWRAQAVTVAQHLEQLKEFYDKWAKDYHKSKPNPMLNPAGFAAWNQGLVTAAKAGLLGGKAQEEVGPLMVTQDFLSREVTNVMAGGFAPFERDAEAVAKDAVPVIYSPMATRKTIDALNRLVEARIKNNLNALPFFGGADNPYLADVSPLSGWSEGKKAWAENPGVWGDLSDADRFKQGGVR